MAKSTRREKATEILPVRLTPVELAARADELANLLQKRDQVDEEKSAANSRFKMQFDEIDTRMSALGRELRDKEVPREVEVTRTMNYSEKIVETVRNDTGELVRTRSMSPDELQMRFLPGGDAQEGASL
jgi:hypothetical protein